MHTHTHETSVWSLVKDYGGILGDSQPTHDPNLVNRPASQCCVEIPKNLRDYFNIVPGIRIPCVQKQIDTFKQMYALAPPHFRMKRHIEHEQYVIIRGNDYDVVRPAKSVEWQSKIVHEPDTLYVYRILFVQAKERLKGTTLHQLKEMVPSLSQSGAPLCACMSIADQSPNTVILSGCTQTYAGEEYLMTPIVSGVTFGHVRHNRVVGNDLFALCELVASA